MGTYSITLNNFISYNRDIKSYENAFKYANNIEFKSQELKLYYSDNTVNTTQNISSIFWNKKSKEYWYATWQGGGSGRLFKLNSSNKWTFIKNIINTQNGTIGPGTNIVQTNSGEIFAMGAGIGLYDKDYNVIPGVYPYAATTSICYDSKRDFIVCGNQNGSFINCITQLDINKQVVGQQYSPSYDPIFLVDLTTIFNSSNPRYLKPCFLTYSSYDDMYYYSLSNNIVKTNPTTGLTEVIITKGVGIIGLMIEEGSNKAFYSYIEDSVYQKVVIGRFELNNPTSIYGNAVLNLKKCLSFYFIYIGKGLIVFSNSYANTADVSNPGKPLVRVITDKWKNEINNDYEFFQDISFYKNTYIGVNNTTKVTQNAYNSSGSAYNILGGEIINVTVTNGGSGYTSAPTISFTQGSGATATAEVSGGLLQSITIINAGASYNNSSSFSNPTQVIINGGGGTGATATVTVGYINFSYNVHNNPIGSDPLDKKESNIHIPFNAPAGAIAPFNKPASFLLKLDAVVPYPVIPTKNIINCCLDELKCDINIKLATSSCNHTNKVIVGRAKNNKNNNLQLLEILLWMSSFDCLSCDEIKLLRCITVKL